MIVQCRYCNKDFKTYPQRLKMGKSKFCSKKCSGESKKGIRLKHLIGYTHSIETRKKLSESNKGKIPWNKGLKGYNSNYPRDKEWKEKMSIAQKGKQRFYAQKENHWNWKGGITPAIEADRARFRKTIQKEVLKRDDYTCQMCGIRGRTLHVDHIQSWKDYVELRFSMSNCRTLCQECHYKITFGKPIKNLAWGNRFHKGGNHLRV